MNAPAPVRAVAAFVAVLAGILAALWIVLNAAGTDWSIPVAVAIVVVTGVILRRTR